MSKAFHNGFAAGVAAERARVAGAATDPIVAALASASPAEARAIMEAMAGWVENQQDGENDPLFAAGEAILERLNAARAV
mgnify:CR=1 FL=1